MLIMLTEPIGEFNRSVMLYEINPALSTGGFPFALLAGERVVGEWYI